MCAVRVAVIDERRLVRDVLHRLLQADPRFDVVAVVEPSFGPAEDMECDILVGGGASSSTHDNGATRVVHLTDDHSLDGIGDALLDATTTTMTPVRVRGEEQEEPRKAPLTSRELEVLEGVSAGLRMEEIAARLGVTRKTVENHKQRIFAKLGVQNQVHAVAVALDLGTLTPDVSA